MIFSFIARKNGKNAEMPEVKALLKPFNDGIESLDFDGYEYRLVTDDIDDDRIIEALTEWSVGGAVWITAQTNADIDGELMILADGERKGEW